MDEDFNIDAYFTQLAEEFDSHKEAADTLFQIEQWLKDGFVSPMARQAAFNLLIGKFHMTFKAGGYVKKDSGTDKGTPS